MEMALFQESDAPAFSFFASAGFVPKVPSPKRRGHSRETPRTRENRNNLATPADHHERNYAHKHSFSFAFGLIGKDAVTKIERRLPNRQARMISLFLYGNYFYYIGYT
jgi:hypothetical protein